MSMEFDPVEDRVMNALKRLQLPNLRETLLAVLSEAAKGLCFRVLKRCLPEWHSDSSSPIPKTTCGRTPFGHHLIPCCKVSRLF
jgi:hypothetical protein